MWGSGASIVEAMKNQMERTRKANEDVFRGGGGNDCDVRPYSV